MNALLGNSVPSSILTLGELTNLHQSGKVRDSGDFHDLAHGRLARRADL